MSFVKRFDVFRHEARRICLTSVEVNTLNGRSKTKENGQKGKHIGQKNKFARIFGKYHRGVLSKYRVHFKSKWRQLQTTKGEFLPDSHKFKSDLVKHDIPPCKNSDKQKSET